MSLPEPVTLAIREAGLDPLYVEDLVRATLEEDLGGGTDVTSLATVPERQRSSAVLQAREPGVVAGLPVVEAVFAATCGPGVEFERHCRDGDRVDSGTKVLTLQAPTRPILMAERTALNVACRLSGIAAATRAWSDALAETPTVVRDTRKTTPLMRPLEKYAVRVGGGENHRASLSAAALIKDNHVVAAGSITAAYQAVTAAYPDIEVEVEVDDVAGAVEAVEAGATLVLLDNFTVEQVLEAVNAVDGRARLEVSGRLSVEHARAYAATGVDFLAVGALTHSVRALDLGLDVVAIGDGDRGHGRPGSARPMRAMEEAG